MSTRVWPKDCDVRIGLAGGMDAEPAGGRCLIFVGINAVQHLQIRVIDASGATIRDLQESQMAAPRETIESLKDRCREFAPPHVLTNRERATMAGDALAATRRPKLTAEQQQYVAANTGLVGEIAKKLLMFGKSRGFDFDELFAIGCEGLCEAATGFDPSRGNTFGTYAGRPIYWKIMGAILTSSMVYPTKHKDFVRVRSIEAMQAESRSNRVDDFIPDHRTTRPGEESADDRYLAIHKAIGMLPKRWAEVLRRRLNNETLSEVGEALGGISRERVRQIETRAREQLRAIMGGGPVPDVEDRKAAPRRPSRKTEARAASLYTSA